MTDKRDARPEHYAARWRNRSGSVDISVRAGWGLGLGISVPQQREWKCSVGRQYREVLRTGKLIPNPGWGSVTPGQRVNP